jgi:hypothetical protein
MRHQLYGNTVWTLSATVTTPSDDATYVNTYSDNKWVATFVGSGSGPTTVYSYNENEATKHDESHVVLIYKITQRYLTANNTLNPPSTGTKLSPKVLSAASDRGTTFNVHVVPTPVDPDNPKKFHVPKGAKAHLSAVCTTNSRKQAIECTIDDGRKETVRFVGWESGKLMLQNDLTYYELPQDAAIDANYPDGRDIHVVLSNGPIVGTVPPPAASKVGDSLVSQGVTITVNSTSSSQSMESSCNSSCKEGFSCQCCPCETSGGSVFRLVCVQVC